MKSGLRLSVALFAGIMLGMAASPSAFADDYPAKPVHIIVGFAPGGFTDVLARLIAQKLQLRLGQPFIVENKPGATGTIGADQVAKSRPDGYTLLMGHVNSNSIAPALYPRLPYDVLKDFTPIVRVASSPMMLVVHPSVPAASVSEFIALAKTRPLRFASSGQGSVQHLAAELFMLATGIRMDHIPYKGSGQAMTDLIGGQVELNFESIPSALQQVKAGKLRSLGVTSARRSDLLPEVPTISEAGVPGFQIEQWFGVFGPANMPKALAQQLADAINAIIRTPDVAAQIGTQGGDLIGGTPENFARFLAKDTREWAELVRNAKVKLD